LSKTVSTTSSPNAVSAILRSSTNTVPFMDIPF
jgi:hypothetical protein